MGFHRCAVLAVLLAAVACAYLPSPAPTWIQGETRVARRGVVALGEAPAAAGIAGADMAAASELAGALDAWLLPALAPLEPNEAKEIYVQVAMVAQVSERWIDPSDGRHHSLLKLPWEDVEKVLLRALHKDERLEPVLAALPGKVADDVAFKPRDPDWMQLKWSQVPADLQRRLPLAKEAAQKPRKQGSAASEDKDGDEVELGQAAATALPTGQGPEPSEKPTLETPAPTAEPAEKVAAPKKKKAKAPKAKAPKAKAPKAKAPKAKAPKAKAPKAKAPKAKPPKAKKPEAKKPKSTQEKPKSKKAEPRENAKRAAPKAAPEEDEIPEPSGDKED